MSAETNSGLLSPRRYPIEPGMPASRAVAIILQQLLGVMAENEEGIIERRGENFLHDYRVAVRRTRSALTLFDQALAPGMLRHGKKLFGGIAKRTGDARDLDVLQLALPGYLKDAAVEDSEVPARLEGRMDRELEVQYAQIRRWLLGAKQRRKVESWHGRLVELMNRGDGAPMVNLVDDSIRKAAKGADRQIEKTVAGDAEAASLHRLRIRFKKLRYALEFSAAFTPDGEIARVIEFLKTMQDRLGAHQDLVVHETWITALCSEESGGALGTHVARRLITSLETRHNALRRSIEADAGRFRDELHEELGSALEALARLARPVRG